MRAARRTPERRGLKGHTVKNLSATSGMDRVPRFFHERVMGDYVERLVRGHGDHTLPRADAGSARPHARKDNSLEFGLEFPVGQPRARPVGPGDGGSDPAHSRNALHLRSLSPSPSPPTSSPRPAPEVT